MDYKNPGYDASMSSNMNAAPPGGVVTSQWMAQPQVPGCPPGLEYLTKVDQILVQQAVELLEAVAGVECANKFVIKNTMGQSIYHAGEDSGFCSRQLCGSRRSFIMHVTDNMGQEVMVATRDFKCCAGCGCCAFSSCCAHEICVESPPGQPIGYVRQSCSCCHPRYEILDADHEHLLTLVGPWLMCECPCCSIDFKLVAPNGDTIGQVSKQWSGAVKELFTEADNFGISFPLDLDVKVKATLIGAVFLINMIFFEQNLDKKG